MFHNVLTGGARERCEADRQEPQVLVNPAD